MFSYRLEKRWTRGSRWSHFWLGNVVLDHGPQQLWESSIIVSTSPVSTKNEVIEPHHSNAAKLHWIQEQRLCEIACSILMKLGPKRLKWNTYRVSDKGPTQYRSKNGILPGRLSGSTARAFSDPPESIQWPSWSYLSYSKTSSNGKPFKFYEARHWSPKFLLRPYPVENSFLMLYSKIFLVAVKHFGTNRPQYSTKLDASIFRSKNRKAETKWKWFSDIWLQLSNSAATISRHI